MTAMRYKVVPPVRDVAFLRSIADALPLVPGSEGDCCSRIRDRTAVPSRDEARRWLTFCQALGLAAETERGYHRVRPEPDETDLRRSFQERVFGAVEVLRAAESGTTGEAAFESLREQVPGWERSRDEDWVATWRERTARLLGWAAVLGLVEQDGDVFRRREADG